MSLVQPLDQTHLNALRGLFAAYPHKQRQQKRQGIDPETLADYFCALEKKRLEQGKAEQWIGLDDQGRTVAFAGLHDDPLHSNHYAPLRFGRVAPFLANEAPEATRQALADRLLEEAHKRGMQQLIARVDASEHRSVQCLQARGFYSVDCSLKLGARIADLPRLAPPSPAAGMRIRPYTRQDLPELARIAASCHSHNHFFNDPHLPAEGARALFGAWVEHCAELPWSRIFTLVKKDQPLGLAIFLQAAALNKVLGLRLLVLDFIGLAPQARGGGIGRWMTSHCVEALAEHFDQLELRTSADNYPALECYQDLGLRILSADTVLHRHA